MHVFEVRSPQWAGQVERFMPPATFVAVTCVVDSNEPPPDGPYVRWHWDCGDSQEAGELYRRFQEALAAGSATSPADFVRIAGRKYTDRYPTITG